MRIFYSPRCQEYWLPGHPEAPGRTRGCYELLKSKYPFAEAKGCSEEDVLQVHSPKHVQRVRERQFYDPDTPALQDVYRYALLAAGAAIQAMEETRQGGAGFSLMRPPGHHSSGQPKGFCYFNNIGVAAARAVRRGERVAILDIDGHHGDGTEALFLRNDHVLYVSLHQYPAYPGTGARSIDNCLNYPLAPGIGDLAYLTELENSLRQIQTFKPDLLAISAGFDTYQKDPLLHLDLSLEAYPEIGSQIRSLNLPTFAVLEGGYSPDLPRCVDSFLQGWQGTRMPE